MTVSRLTQVVQGSYAAHSHLSIRQRLQIAIGAGLGVFVSGFVCQYFFASSVMLALIGPLGASAVLLFSVSSSPLAQPWSLVASYLLATLVASGLGYSFGYSLEVACLAAAMTLLLMFFLRCLHPPGAAMALCIVLSGPTLAPLGIAVVLPVLTHGLCLLGCALLYNNLCGIRYPNHGASVQVKALVEPIVLGASTGQAKLRDLLEPSVTLEASTSLKQALRAMAAQDCEHLIVTQNGRPLALLNALQLLQLHQALSQGMGRWQSKRLSDGRYPAVLRLSSELSLQQAAVAMAEAHDQQALISTSDDCVAVLTHRRVEAALLEAERDQALDKVKRLTSHAQPELPRAIA